MPAIPSAVSGIPVLGGIVDALDNTFSSPERKLKNALEKAGLITAEQRKLLDDGDAPGYPKGDAGIGPKLRDMGVDPATVAQLCQQLGVSKNSVDPELMWPDGNDSATNGIFDNIFKNKNDDDEEDR